MQHDRRKTFDFCKSGKARRRRPEQVAELLIDGWKAYDRWRDDLKKRLFAITG